MRKTRYLTHVQTSTQHTHTHRNKERERNLLGIYLLMINIFFQTFFYMSKEQEISELLFFLERKKMSIQNKERKKSVCINLFYLSRFKRNKRLCMYFLAFFYGKGTKKSIHCFD
jgi:hypothetical protein